MKLRILCARPGFRRAGVAHEADHTWPASAFTPEQVRQLETEPLLTVIKVPEEDGDPAFVSAEAAVRMLPADKQAELREHFRREFGLARAAAAAPIGTANAPIADAARESSVHPAGTAGAPEIPVVGTEPVLGPLPATTGHDAAMATSANLARAAASVATDADRSAVHPAGTAGAGGIVEDATVDQAAQRAADAAAAGLGAAADQAEANLNAEATAERNAASRASLDATAAKITDTKATGRKGARAP